MEWLGHAIGHTITKQKSVTEHHISKNPCYAPVLDDLLIQIKESFALMIPW